MRKQIIITQVTQFRVYIPVGIRHRELPGKDPALTQPTRRPKYCSREMVYVRRFTHCQNDSIYDIMRAIAMQHVLFCDFMVI